MNASDASLADRSIRLVQRHAPDSVVRALMRRALALRLRRERRRNPAERAAWLADWSAGPIAVATPDANEQHYEVPTELFEAMLGPRLKYSSCRWEHADDLAAAEDEMLAATVELADVHDGMRILDMGSGWGSMSGYLAERFPNCEIEAVSTSATQHDYIAERYPTVRHTVADIADFRPAGTFDRVISVEMVEHVRNHRALFERIGSWLAPGGRVALHHFAHQTLFYPFDDDGPGAWMARRFFTGGIMPSHDYFVEVLDGWRPVEHEWIAGTHYARTLEAWLVRLDAHLDDHPDALAAEDAADWRWFLMACAELFAADDEWGVTHTVLEPAT